MKLKILILGGIILLTLFSLKLFMKGNDPEQNGENKRSNIKLANQDTKNENIIILNVKAEKIKKDIFVTFTNKSNKNTRITLGSKKLNITPQGSAKVSFTTNKELLKIYIHDGIDFKLHSQTLLSFSKFPANYNIYKRKNK